MIERSLKLSKILGDSRSAFLFGARGVGKTHLATQWLALKDRTFSVNLLEPEHYERYLRDPGRLLADIEGAHKGQQLSVLIDEIQKLPVLLDVVHHLYEKHRKQIQFLLTGSSARKLKRQGANLLAGRTPNPNVRCEPTFILICVKRFSSKRLFERLTPLLDFWKSQGSITAK